MSKERFNLFITIVGTVVCVTAALTASDIWVVAAALLTQLGLVVWWLKGS